jgi:hypothetical protein
MATIIAQTANKTGTIKTLVAASAGGDQFANFGREIVELNNASGAPILVTFAPAGLPGGLALATYNVSVAAGTTKIVGPFDSALFSSAAGLVTVSYSGVASLTIAVISVP